MRRLAFASLLLLLPTGCASFEAAACGGPGDPGADAEVILPDTIGGLDVERDRNATQTLNKESNPKDTYQCPGSGRVYALRKAKELRAVLQISRLAPDARLDDIEFLRGLVKGPTGNILEPIEQNCIDVYSGTSAGNEQLVTMWFKDRYMFFLTVREDQTLPGVAVDVDFASVLDEALRFVTPEGYTEPDPAACPSPSVDPVPVITPSEVPIGTLPASPVTSEAATTTPVPSSS